MHDNKTRTGLIHFRCQLVQNYIEVVEIQHELLILRSDRFVAAVPRQR